jgi:hypothetical protein
MSTTTTTTTTAPETYTLNLQTAYGPRQCEVSTKAPRECTREEIPIVDISGIDGDLEARQKIADEVRKASETSGFFYLQNHGIDDDIIQNACQQALRFVNPFYSQVFLWYRKFCPLICHHYYRFFRQSEELKRLTNKDFKYINNGWTGPKSIHISPDESPGVFLSLLQK